MRLREGSSVERRITGTCGLVLARDRRDRILRVALRGIGCNVFPSVSKLEAEVVAWIEPCAQRWRLPGCCFIELEPAVTSGRQPIGWNRQDGGDEVVLSSVENQHSVTVRG